MPRRGWQTVGRAIRLGESSQGTQAQVRAVATREREEGGHAAHEQVAPRQVQSFHTTGCVEGASSSIAEPCARGRRSRSHRGGSQVGSRSVGPRRGNRPCEASVESSGRCLIEIQDRTSGKKDRVVQGFPRKSSEAGRPLGRSHCKGHHREGGLSARNCGERMPFGEVGSTSCRHSNRCSGRCFGGKFAGEDQRSAEGAGCIVGSRHPSFAKASVDGRWSTFIGQHSSIAQPGRGTLVELAAIARCGMLWNMGILAESCETFFHAQRTNYPRPLTATHSQEWTTKAKVNETEIKLRWSQTVDKQHQQKIYEHESNRRIENR